MDQLWKTATFNNQHRHELLQQAEQDRLARLAMRNSRHRNMLLALAQKLLAQMMRLRIVLANRPPRGYHRHNIAIENNQART